MPTRPLVLVAAALALGACSSGGAGGADADLTAFVSACRASSNLPQTICECAGRKAQAELSADGFAFLTATLAQEEAKMEELRSRLDVEQTMKAGTFMVRGPAACSREQAGTGNPGDSQ